MTFLKVIASISTAILLLILMNNLMAFMFKVNSEKYIDSYSECGSLYNSQTSQLSETESQQKQKEYQDCVNKAQTKTNDARALRFQSALLRGMAGLLVLVVIAVALFKRFPFFSSSLIAGGLLFVLSYPWFVSLSSSSGNSLSSDVQAQTQLIKFIISLVGFIGLAVADIFFFEKDHVKPSVPVVPANPTGPISQA